MKTKQLPLLILASVPALSLLFSACSSTVPGGQTTAVATSTTSTTVVDTFTATARVSAIDPATRTLTLALENGKQTTMKCGSQVANFKQIRVNDVVTVSATEELSIYLDKSGKMGTSGGAVGVLAPLGAKPGLAASDTVKETVKITGIDKGTRKVTFVDSNGISQTTKVGEHIDLAKAKVGDKVTISHTQAVAVSVQKS